MTECCEKSFEGMVCPQCGINLSYAAHEKYNEWRTIDEIVRGAEEGVNWHECEKKGGLK